MSRFIKLFNAIMVSSLVISAGMTGCTKKPSNEESSKLEEARAAAESAERKLSDLRQERIKLEQDLQAKQAQQPQ